MDVLPEVVDAVAARGKIIIDGGFNRGTDIIKAIASGADLVGMGRLEAAAMAAAGEPGLIRMLEILQHEMQTSMGLMGVTKLADLNRSYLQKAPAVTTPGVLSAFPLLTLEEGTFY
jgi:glycolate oxidase